MRLVVIRNVHYCQTASRCAINRAASTEETGVVDVCSGESHGMESAIKYKCVMLEHVKVVEQIEA